ncbi:pyridoxine 5'-phosphate synthase [Fodinicurvata halophila]|uniref:Pyridoxine 5'-phosphate synthase n=1 Tax=Fodinicurvata halophila TaxID=1419723 RepID=A0ABV8UJC2_9PROT
MSGSLPRLRLGVNIDHVATLRNARGGVHPDPVAAALQAIDCGADGITAHLREDRRHIRDEDIMRLKKEISRPLNLEMAATQEMLSIALETRPHACCLVPEKREEVTTEGGLEVRAQKRQLAPYAETLSEAGIRVSLFIDPEEEQLEASRELRVPIVELHTGAYCEAFWRTGAESREAKQEFLRLENAARLASKLGLECHAGHGLTYETAERMAAISDFVEFNIGHFLIGEAVFEGLSAVLARMRSAMESGRDRTLIAQREGEPS